MRKIKYIEMHGTNKKYDKRCSKEEFFDGELMKEFEVKLEALFKKCPKCIRSVKVKLKR